MAEIVNALFEVGVVVSVAPDDGIVGAKAGDGSIVIIESWDPVQGDTTHYAPAGSVGGGGTRRHLFDREVYVDTGGAVYVNVRAFASLTGVPTTVQGYGITNAIRNDQNGTIAGTLGVTSVSVTGGSSGQGKMYANASAGLVLESKTGSVYDFVLATPGDTANILSVVTGARHVSFGGDVRPITDAASDIGTGSFRWRHGNFSGNMSIGGTLAVTSTSNFTGAITAAVAGFSGAVSLTGTTVNLSTAGAAFAFTGTTVASVADTASGAITFNANIGRGTGAVGGFVFAVPFTTVTGTTAQTLNNALVIKATSTQTQVFLGGTEVTPFAGASLNSQGQRMFSIAAAGPSLSFFKSNGTLAAPTIVTTGNGLGQITFGGCMTGASNVNAVTIVASATENWVATTNSGAKVVFSVTQNGTTGTVVALTLEQDKTATFSGTINPATDAALDVGGSSFRWRHGYFSGTVTTGTVTATGAVSAQTGAITGSGAVLLGADISATTLTNVTRKIGVLATPHYTNANAKVLGLWVDADAATNIVTIGGGLAGFNAATTVAIYAAANNNAGAGAAVLSLTSTTAVFGTLAISGVSTIAMSGAISGATSIQITGGGSGAGKVWFDGTDGLIVQGKAGSGNNFSVYTPTSGYVLYNPITTSDVVFAGIIRPSVDAGNDFGSGSFRWRNGSFSGTLNTGSVAAVGTIGTTAMGIQAKQSSDNYLEGLRFLSAGDSSGLYMYYDGTNCLLTATYQSSGSYKAIAFNTSDVERLKIAVNGGLTIGAAPTGGSKGAGTINLAGDIYKNNTAYTNPDFVFEAIFTGTVVDNIDKVGAEQFLEAFVDRGNRIMTISEVREFARERHRLPGVGDAIGLFDRSEVALTQIELAHAYIWQIDDRLTALEGFKARAVARFPELADVA